MTHSFETGYFELEIRIEKNFKRKTNLKRLNNVQMSIFLSKGIQIHIKYRHNYLHILVIIKLDFKKNAPTP